MNRFLWIASIFVFIAAFSFSCNPSKRAEERDDMPNVVVIYFDDLGYGDVGSYGGTGIETPSIDSLAAGGMRFTSGYATSATCTPSRYALLTGVYPWRNREAKILPGTAPMLIDTSMMTLPKMFREKGYRTAIVGKWHLGLGDGNVDWNERIAPGPTRWDLRPPISWRPPRTGYPPYTSRTVMWSAWTLLIPSR